MFSTPEEDEMGSPQPSAAMELAKRIQERVSPNGWYSGDWDTIPAWLDAYAAAALTDEQRDVLTLADFAASGGYLHMWSTKSGMRVEIGKGADANEYKGASAIAEAATWVREQGAN